MKKKNKFGIISGAGPMAGALLYQLVIEQCQKQGAWRDADFPEILLLNLPFSEMLLGEKDNKIVRDELLKALDFISKHVDFVYIACQTLHVFLTDEEMIRYKVVSLLLLIKQTRPQQKNKIVVVGSKTSRLSDLHPKYLALDCSYVEEEKSEKAIDEILKGNIPDLTWLEKLTNEYTVILGCTEFSVALEESTSFFIDPIKLAADDMVNKFFQ